MTRHLALHGLTVLIAIFAIGLCLHAAARIERTADENLRARANQDSARIAQNLVDWAQLRRQSLRGLAALFASADRVTPHEFAKAVALLRLQGDNSTLEIPLAAARISPDHRSLKIVYSTETYGLLAQGRDLSGNVEAMALLKTAFPVANHTVLSPVFHNQRGDPSAYMALAVPNTPDGDQLIITLVNFRDMFAGAASPELGIVARMDVLPPDGTPIFIQGSETQTPATLFTLVNYGEFYGNRYRQMWDILPNYIGNQTGAQELAITLRYGGSLLILAATLFTWLMLNLYQRSCSRELALEEARDRLAENEHHYRTLIDQVPGVVFRCSADIKREMVYLSPAVEALTGYAAAELLGERSLMSLVHQDDLLVVRQKIHEALTGETHFELEYRLIDRHGEEHWVYEHSQVSGIRASQLMIDGVLIDISARKLAEAAQKQTAELLRGIIDNAPDVVILGLDLDGCFLLWNRAGERMLGWREDELLGKSFKEFDFVSERAADQALSDYQRIAETGELLPPREWMIRRRNGDIACLLCTLFPAPWQDQTAVVCIGIDITERKQMEDALVATRNHLEELVTARTDDLHQRNEELKQAMGQLVQSEKLASLGNLVAGIAHELNTPLGNSVTVASTLRQKVHEFQRLLEEKQLRKSELERFTHACDEAAHLMEKSSQRASELIHNFKQVAVDTASTRRRSFDLRQTVDEVISTLRPAFKHTPHSVDIDIPIGLVLESYPGPLEQILTNLVTNSLAHAFDGIAHGSISISARAEEHDRICLVFKDNGRGIPDELKRRVFDPFFTTRLGQGGSGLGLYIVFNLVHGVLGGQLTLDDAPGGGAHFTFSLPRIAPHPKEATLHDQTETETG